MEDQTPENPGEIPAGRKAHFESQKHEVEKAESSEARIYREVVENVAMQKFFEGFKPASVKDYIKEYVSQKTSWISYGEMYIGFMEANEMQWINQAWDHLKVIQQKKLFDAQCLWRAGKAHFEEIEICIDFEIWEEKILNCPFIEPINEEDITLYSGYLLSDDAEIDFGWFPEWQNYDEYKTYNDDEEGFQLPEWYEYADLHRGTGVLLALPNLRGEREDYYENLARKKRRVQREIDEAQKTPSPPTDNKPIINHYDESFGMDWFVHTFETKENIRLYDAMRWRDKIRNYEESFEDSLKLLVEAEEQVPIKANVDFREGIIEAARAYSARNIVAALPKAFEEYAFRQGMGLPFEYSEDSVKSMEIDVRPNYVSRILEGRKIAGEPEDLNYWNEKK